MGTSHIRAGSRARWGVTALAALVSLCAPMAMLLARPAIAEPSRLPVMANELRAAMDAHERRLQKAGVAIDHCQVGLTFARDGHTIVAIGDAAARLGFAVGDRLEALGGERYAPRDDDTSAFARWSKGDRISATVKRGDASRSITGECPYSSRDSRRLLDDLVIVMLRDRPEECLAKLDPLDRQFGTSIDSLRVRWQCFERASEKGGWKRAKPDEYASALGDAYVQWIDSAAGDPETLEVLRPDVDGVVSSLTRAGQIGPATAISAAFRKAAGEASGPIVTPSPAPGPSPTAPPVPVPSPLPGRNVFFGSCFFVTPDGFVATNAHVIEGKSTIRVIDSKGEVYETTGARRDPGNDLALLRVETSGHAYLSLAPAGVASVGQEIFTMGYPATSILGHAPKFTDGVISSLSGLDDAPNLMQVTVPIQPGNSGGPVVTDRGQVVGVATSTAAVEVFLRATGSLPQNVNWAVKAELLKPMIEHTPPARDAAGRTGAIELTTAAVCRVEAR
jgi:S1-C subfamily serine protease